MEIEKPDKPIDCKQAAFALEALRETFGTIGAFYQAIRDTLRTVEGLQPTIYRVANKYHRKLAAVRVVVLRGDRIRAEIRWEPASDKNLYPHIYGPLNMDAAERSLLVNKGANDEFVILNPNVAEEG